MNDINEYRVEGMTCSGCATKVTAAVRSVPGVVTSDVDLATGRVRVTGRAVDAASDHAAITGAGSQLG